MVLGKKYSIVYLNVSHFLLSTLSPFNSLIWFQFKPMSFFMWTFAKSSICFSHFWSWSFQAILVLIAGVFLFTKRKFDNYCLKLSMVLLVYKKSPDSWMQNIGLFIIWVWITGLCLYHILNTTFPPLPIVNLLRAASCITHLYILTSHIVSDSSI